MANTLVRVDGLPVAVGTANAFLTRLKPAFEKAFPGYTLHVYSGYRSYAEQEAIFRQRYTLTPNGRRVYDTRWWNGRLWYRIDPAGTVAQPGTSNHGDGRALDIRDSGSTPGVTQWNNARSNWIRANARSYGFEPDGFTFNEPWHIRYLGDPWAGSAPAPAETDSKPKEEVDNVPPTEENVNLKKTQKLEKGKFWPIEIQPKGEKRFASTGNGQKERGSITLDLRFSGGPNTGTLGRIRAFYEEKRNGKWVRIKTRMDIEIPATTGQTTFQYSDKYNFGANVRAQFEIQADHDKVNLIETDYRKEYWR